MQQQDGNIVWYLYVMVSVYSGRHTVYSQIDVNIDNPCYTFILQMFTMAQQDEYCPPVVDKWTMIDTFYYNPLFASGSASQKVTISIQLYADYYVYSVWAIL